MPEIPMIAKFISTSFHCSSLALTIYWILCGNLSCRLLNCACTSFINWDCHELSIVLLAISILCSLSLTYNLLRPSLIFVLFKNKRRYPWLHKLLSECRLGELKSRSVQIFSWPLLFQITCGAGCPFPLSINNNMVSERIWHDPLFHEIHTRLNIHSVIHSRFYGLFWIFCMQKWTHAFNINYIARNGFLRYSGTLFCCYIAIVRDPVSARSQSATAINITCTI
jgi:hypothetical protein